MFLGERIISDRDSIKSDLFFTFRKLYERGFISKEELEKCNKKVMDGDYLKK